MPAISPLRRYQLEPFRAILAAAEAHDADIITVRMSRQAGKNEISARVERALLAVHHKGHRHGVKAAPTQNPQAIRSRDRLAQAFRRAADNPAAKRAIARLLRVGDSTVAFGTSDWWFGSGEREANVVGATADLLLEFDEAQDFDQDKHDRDYAPMAAAKAAARVYYGTAWSDFDLLEVMRQAALDREHRDGRRRVFDVPWTRVAEEVEPYGLFVEAERQRLGHTEATPHPVFRTQYELVPMGGAGRLFTPAQLNLFQGDHPRLDAPLSESHNTYVAGLDVGGANLSGSTDPDETVLTIARARFPTRGSTTEPDVAIVQQYAWGGMDHDRARVELLRLLNHWRVTHVTVDATGIGEPLATHLVAQLGERKVTAFKFTQQSKSSLGFDLVAAVNNGALRMWKPEGFDADHQNTTRQTRLCKRELKGGKLAWAVAEADGHDDRLVSVALALRAAQRGKPRIATSGR